MMSYDDIKSEILKKEKIWLTHGMYRGEDGISRNFLMPHWKVDNATAWFGWFSKPLVDESKNYNMDEYHMINLSLPVSLYSHVSSFKQLS